jgi:hypothetical protein
MQKRSPVEGPIEGPVEGPVEGHGAETSIAGNIRSSHS